MESLATTALSTWDQNTQLFTAAAFTNGPELLEQINTHTHTHTHTHTQLPWAQTQKRKNYEQIHKADILKTNRLKRHRHTHTHTLQYHSDSSSLHAQTQICHFNSSPQQPSQTFTPRQISLWLRYLTQLSLQLLWLNSADTVTVLLSRL